MREKGKLKIRDSSSQSRAESESAIPFAGATLGAARAFGVVASGSATEVCRERSMLMRQRLEVAIVRRISRACSCPASDSAAANTGTPAASHT